MTAWRDAYAQECVRRDCQQGCGKGCKRWLEQIDGGEVCNRCQQEFTLRGQYLDEKQKYEEQNIRMTRLAKESEDRGIRINQLVTETQKKLEGENKAQVQTLELRLKNSERALDIARETAYRAVRFGQNLESGRETATDIQAARVALRSGGKGRGRGRGKGEPIAPREVLEPGPPLKEDDWRVNVEFITQAHHVADSLYDCMQLSRPFKQEVGSIVNELCTPSPDEWSRLDPIKKQQYVHSFVSSLANLTYDLEEHLKGARAEALRYKTEYEKLKEECEGLKAAQAMQARFEEELDELRDRPLESFVVQESDTESFEEIGA